MAKSSRKRKSHPANSSTAPRAGRSGKRRELAILLGVAGVGLVAYVPSTWPMQLVGGAGLRYVVALVLYFGLVGFAVWLRRPQRFAKSLVYAAALGGLIGAPGLGAGGVQLVNWALDAAPREQVTTVVQGVSDSPRNRTSFALELEPWGDLEGPVTVAVPKRLYDSLGSGRRVRVWVGDGALGMPWVKNRDWGADVQAVD